MKTDAEVLLMQRERAKGRTQEQAATKAGMSVRTARTYERRARLPSQLKQPRTYRSRPDPFAEDWQWVVEQLEQDPALQGQTLFGLLCDRHPGRYHASQLRTLQRQIAVGGRLAVNPQSFTRSDDVVLVLGTFTLSGRRPDGTPLARTARFADVLRRQPDGSWRIAVDNPFAGD